MSKKVTLIVIIVAVIASIIIVIRLLSGEDNWICDDGAWVKHGSPSSPAPTTPCGEESNTNEKSNTNQKESSQYNWSTMSKGPYRDQISYATT